MRVPEVSRRRFVGATAGVAGALALGTVGTAGPAAALPAQPGGSGAALPAQGAGSKAALPARNGIWRDARSANGWPVLEQAERFAVEGSGRTVELAKGDAAVILLYVARRFHYEIAPLREGDVLGHRRSRRIRERHESNQLSGTALTIRAHAYPAGVRGGLYPNELLVVRDILAELDGSVVWGGDLRSPKESHFEIALKPGHPKVKGVARRIGAWNAGPGDEGAGATDAFDPKRRARAAAFARRAG
ncbi:hypothetical protein [Streptomyces sp. NPDC048309]|uniref:hypothetical protein n=1 Tax=unclassified Streptomyces TaxID=2593676 RepID=UPI0034083DE8